MTPAISAPAKPIVRITVESPFPQHALPRLWRWVEESRRQVADEFSPKTLDELVAYWEQKTRGGQRSWGVWRDGELGGVVSSMRLSPVSADAHCIFRRSFWGHDTTAEALRLVFAEIFGGGVHKINTVCFFDNHSLLGLVRRIGFEREGTLRKNVLRDGKLVDQALIGLTKDRFAEIEATRLGEPAVVVESAKDEVTECLS